MSAKTPSISALTSAYGPTVGLREIEEIQDNPLLKNYYLLPASKAELHRRNGDTTAAKKSLKPWKQPLMWPPQNFPRSRRKKCLVAMLYLPMKMSSHLCGRKGESALNFRMSPPTNRFWIQRELPLGRLVR